MSQATEEKSASKQLAVVVGVGLGLSRSLALKWASEGYNLILVSRSGKNSVVIKEEISKLHPNIYVECLNVDTSDETQVTTEYNKLLASKSAELGEFASCLIYNAGPSINRRSILDTKIDEFNKQLQVGCTGALIWSKLLLPSMLKQHQGTLLFTGATAALRGGANFQELACPKFALRALTQSLAREFQKEGIHTAHIIVDGPIWNQKLEKMNVPKDKCMDPVDLAETWWNVHAQKKSAWTQELDIRSYQEKW